MKILKLYYRNFKYLFPIIKFYIFILLLIKIIAGILPYLNLVITTNLVTLISNYIFLKTGDTRNIFLFLILQLIVLFSSPLINIIQEYVDSHMEMKTDIFFQRELINVLTNVPYNYYDSPEFYQRLNHVRTNGLGRRLITPIQSSINILSALISISSTLYFLIHISWVLAIIGIFSSVPSFILYSKIGKFQYKLMKNQIPRLQETNYIFHLFQNKISVKEIRTYNISKYLFDKWDRLYELNIKEKLTLLKKNQYRKVLLQLFTTFCYGLAYIIVIKLLIKGKLNVGNFVVVPQGISNLQSGGNQISTNIANLSNTSNYISDYYEFMDLYKVEVYIKNSKVNKIQSYGKTGAIKFENVDFSYFGQNKAVLKNLSLNIDTNEKIAIVGANGSGKTTLIKCLLGLYQPTKGNIYLNDVNINSIDLEEIQNHISVVFQDFTKFNFSIRENIGFGNLNKIFDEEAIIQAAKNTGMDDIISKFEKKYDTRLGNYLENGEELSGGQWQKIALARAMFKESEILILDEPTSALDPVSEYNFYKRILNGNVNKTIIFIAHRMASVKFAEKIVVMKNGEIVEVGTHEKLLSLKGEYYEMYLKQIDTPLTKVNA